MSSPAESDGKRAGDRRRSRRRPLPGLFVAVEPADESNEMCWAGNALDVNGDGFGLNLPPEVEDGSRVLLTFHLDGVNYDRVPARVERQDGEAGVGAVQFQEWPEGLRLALLSYLLER